jgi:signal transduction histidine kinase
MRQAQKMESLGVLAGGIAHDFNNLLVAMLGQIALARRQMQPAHPAHGAISKAETAAQKAASLTAANAGLFRAGPLSDHAPEFERFIAR